MVRHDSAVLELFMHLVLPLEPCPQNMNYAYSLRLFVALIRLFRLLLIDDIV